jgi:hypothetical protein
MDPALPRDGRTEVSLFDKVKNLARQHEDTIAKGLDKAADLANQKTGGKHRDKIDKIDKVVQEAKKRTGDGPGTTRP